MKARKRCQATPIDGWRPTTTNHAIDTTTLMVATSVMAAARPVYPSGSSAGLAQAVSGNRVQVARARSAESGEAARWACSSIRRARTQATTAAMIASTKCAWKAVEPAKREVRGPAPPSESAA